MPKIKKDTIKKLPQTPTLKIFKYDNSNIILNYLN